MNTAWKIILIVIVIGAVIWGVAHYRATATDDSGAVTWLRGKPSDKEAADFARKNSGDDEASSPKPASSSQTMTPSRVGLDTTSTAVNPPVAAQPAGFPAPSPASNNNSDAQLANSPANAPDGYRFASSGKFEFYRQGNLTFRLDTATGRTCIVFATLEEWRKPLVMNRGCANAS